jgi:valyl-tRNA synthetase
LTDQWYVDAETLAKPAIEAARKGKANGGFDIVPKSWEKTYFNWMENIQPWCVSRQLWWGHQIPAWFAADGTCYVAETEEAAQALAGTGVELTRDPDVLDTWFSSALWPFGTLGWPDESNALNRHYPNDVLISGFDILFFWDARMAMQGIHFMKEVPWKTLYLHGLVRAADGSKMSKSKGNTVDPLGLIDQYGADALRFFMAAMESQGRDIKMDESRVAGYRNFATKLWNAARFAQSNGISGSHSINAPKAELASGSAIDPVDTTYLKTLMGYNARRAALSIIELFLERLAPYGLKPVDFSVMSTIQHNPGVTSRQLCTTLNLLPPNLVGLIQSLESRGLIERKPHPHDGRAVGLHATAKGQALMVQAEQTASELEIEKTAKLTPAQRQTLLTLLQKIYL